jgi:CRP-like cAMP-binding protein
MPPANAGACGTPFVQYRAGARRNCFDAGDPIQRVYFPTSCLISLVVSTGEGEQVETGMIGREGAAGLQSARGPRCSFARAIVQVPGESYTVSGGMQVRLTQKFPGEMLGIRRTSVTLLAQGPQARGIIRYTRGRITILDRSALKSCACECYQTVQELYRGLNGFRAIQFDVAE